MMSGMWNKTGPASTLEFSFRDDPQFELEEEGLFLVDYVALRNSLLMCFAKQKVTWSVAGKVKNMFIKCESSLKHFTHSQVGYL